MADRTPPRPGRSSASRPAAGARPSAGGSSSASRGSAPRTGAPRTGGQRSGPAKSAGTRPGASRTGQARAGQAGPGKARPALAARPRAAPPVPPSPSTAWVRGAILFGIVVMLAVTLVPTLRSVIQQRGEASALRETIAAQRVSVTTLERQAALWKDPDYIEVQARERLKFVRIGDRAYIVVDPTRGTEAETGTTSPVVSAPMANDSSPWYGKVWQSIQIADRPTAGLPQKK